MQCTVDGRLGCILIWTLRVFVSVRCSLTCRAVTVQLHWSNGLWLLYGIGTRSTGTFMTYESAVWLMVCTCIEIPMYHVITTRFSFGQLAQLIETCQGVKSLFLYRSLNLIFNPIMLKPCPLCMLPVSYEEFNEYLFLLHTIYIWSYRSSVLFLWEMYYLLQMLKWYLNLILN